MNKQIGSNGLSFYITPTHPCSYFPERNARTVFADPTVAKNTPLYSRLSASGFRRSGSYIYRPQCPECSDCVPVRVDARAFKPTRGQRRCAGANADLVTVSAEAEFSEAHFELYQRYIRARHPGGGMDTDDPKRYMEFLSARWADTRFVEFRDATKLVAVAVVDQLLDGLSAVYTFFDPDERQRSPGVFAILWQIRRCQELGLDWLYLGYWIDQCDKMQYKQDYYPQERYREGQWQSPPQR